MTYFRANSIFPGILSKALLAGVLISTWAVQAASLGKLTVSSYLGQPLNAEIALESVTAKEVDSLSARLASPKIFQKVGIDLAPYHATLSISVEKRTNGLPYVHISSSQPISEPFLKLLIELNSPSGHLLREYNVLLDPIEIQKSVLAEPVVQAKDDEVEDFTPPVKKYSVAQPASPTQGGNTYGPVAPGDTLSRIARQVSPDSVNLNQMLVALYRANRDAFLEKNMNLLKVGVILRIPDENETLSITTREASREVTVQKESWDNYRQKVATLAEGASEGQELKQSQTGKITTVSKEVTKSNKPEEVLILSKGELISDDHPPTEKTEDKTAQNYLHMMEEDAIAKERALQEANERVAILEQNVANLQRLLGLKESSGEDSVVVEQKQAQPAADSQKEPTPEKQIDTTVAQALTKASDPTVAESLKSSATPMTIPAKPIKPSAPPQSLQPVSDESDEPDFVDSLLQQVDENSQWAAAGLGALLVIALGISLARRKREQSEDFDSSNMDDEEKPDELATSLLSGITPTQMADKEELDDEPAQQTTSTSKPDDVVDTVDSYTDVDPGLFFAGKQDEKTIESLFASTDSIVHEQTEDNTIFDELDTLDKEIGSDLTPSDQTEYQEEVFVDVQKSIDQEAHDAKEEWIFTSPHDHEVKLDTAPPQDSDDEHSSFHDAEHQIDFDLKLPEEEEENQELRTKNEWSELGSSLANIDLDLGDNSNASSQAASEEMVDVDMQRREVATKLDLAKAYLEMDDSEGAKDILEEVLREGDLEQQSLARSMLDKIN